MYIYQTMSNFGYMTHFIAMIAGFIILRLRSILGKKLVMKKKYIRYSENFRILKAENTVSTDNLKR